MARASRGRLLAVHRRWLGHADLEDCYSQATLELLAQARHGALRCSSHAHLRRILEQRFTSRIIDRRRALAGRSPREATLDGALSLGLPGGREIEVADTRGDAERLTMLRCEVRSLQLASHALTPDQRLVLACQLLGMSRADFCARFHFSHEKYRKVAQRARARLRLALAEAERWSPSPHTPSNSFPQPGDGFPQPGDGFPRPGESSPRPSHAPAPMDPSRCDRCVGTKDRDDL